MKKVEAALKRYNANTRDAYVGDCVKRSLSVAYSMDYDKVGAELNRIKREIGAGGYNWDIVFNRFMDRRGDKFKSVGQKVVTVDEFCDAHPTGVWLILCGKKSPTAHGSHSTHMAAIVNGNVYDSWDSRDYYVFNFTDVHEGSTAEYEMDVDDIHVELTEYLKDYADQLSQKCPECMRPIHVLESYDRANRYTYEQIIRIKFGKLPDDKYSYILPWHWREGKNICHVLTIKMNPRMSVEENLNSLKAKCKQKIYDWVYEIRRKILDAEKFISSTNIHPRFRGERALLMKMPDWAIPRITWAEDNGAGFEYGERYNIDMEAFPEDPRYQDNPEVAFYGDSLRELKDNMNYYKKNYARYGYDY